MKVDVLSAIRTQYVSFTPVERQIADYVLAHAQEVVYLPITDLAYRCDVGETSVMRFCRHIGQQGYQSFRLALLSSLETLKLQSSEPAVLSNDPIQRSIDLVYRKHLAALNSTWQLLRADQLKMIVERMRNAPQIYFFGLNYSQSAAMSAAQAFLLATGKGIFPDPYSQHLLSKLLNPLDVAVIFSHCGGVENCLSIARQCEKTSAFTVGVTCCGESELSKLCDVTLCCGCNSNPLFSSDLDQITGKTSFTYVVEALCTAYLSAGKAG